MAGLLNHKLLILSQAILTQIILQQTILQQILRSRAMGQHLPEEVGIFRLALQPHKLLRQGIIVSS